MAVPIRACVVAYRAMLKTPIGTLERIQPDYQKTLAFLVGAIADEMGLTPQQVQTAFEQMSDD